MKDDNHDHEENDVFSHRQGSESWRPSENPRQGSELWRPSEGELPPPSPSRSNAAPPRPPPPPPRSSVLSEVSSVMHTSQENELYDSKESNYNSQSYSNHSPRTTYLQSQFQNETYDSSRERESAYQNEAYDSSQETYD